jgi:hypothetical protein
VYDETPPATHEERVLAALAHVGIVANSFNLLGIIGAALIWMTQRQRSPYVAAHALQALAFQVMAVLLGILLLLIWGGCLVVALLPAMLRPSLYQSDLPLAFWLALGIGLLLLLALAAIVMVYGLMGAAAAWRGKPFRYAVVGSLIEEMQHAAATPPADDTDAADALDDAAEPTADQVARSASGEAAKD